jgi:AraC-like DNA-binding protein
MKAERWRDLLAEEVKWPVALSNFDNDNFEARMDVLRNGPFCFRSHWIHPVIANRSEAHLSSVREPAFFLSLQTRGRLVMSQYGLVTTLGAGDMVLTDCAAPGCLRYEQPTHSLVLRIPRDILAERIPSPERLCNMPMARMGFATVIKEMMLSIWHEGINGMDEDLGVRSSNLLIDLIATSYAASTNLDIPESAISTARMVQIKRHIEINLRDPDLTPSSIAQEFRMSQRYLRKLFSANAESVSRHIQNRRLEECASQLAHSLWRGHTITEIAFAWGFNSSAHFTKLFRSRYGMSPKQYRQLNRP